MFAITRVCRAAGITAGHFREAIESMPPDAVPRARPTTSAGCTASSGAWSVRGRSRRAMSTMRSRASGAGPRAPAQRPGADRARARHPAQRAPAARRRRAALRRRRRRARAPHAAGGAHTLPALRARRHRSGRAGARRRPAARCRRARQGRAGGGRVRGELPLGGSLRRPARSRRSRCSSTSRSRISRSPADERARHGPGAAGASDRGAARRARPDLDRRHRRGRRVLRARRRSAERRARDRARLGRPGLPRAAAARRQRGDRRARLRRRRGRPHGRRREHAGRAQRDRLHALLVLSLARPRACRPPGTRARPTARGSWRSRGAC